ncbi:MAG: 30S ribosomal protein S4 [Candidatus Aenigmatarchaeota archaeon]|nr:MAG: 30S ribosomal protein S4 [Candidatus Aenigmarchaeota archaeon]
MGDPKQSRSRIESPLKAWDSKRIERENALLKEFGLRRKQELRRAESILRGLRRQARELGASKDERQQKQLLARVSRLNLMKESGGLDDVLGLSVNDVLSRRLQTIIHRKGIANTLKQSRQLITHGHVVVGNRRIVWPSFLVSKDLEEQIKIKGVEVQKK